MEPAQTAYQHHLLTLLGCPTQGHPGMSGSESSLWALPPSSCLVWPKYLRPLLRYSRSDHSLSSDCEK